MISHRVQTLVFGCVCLLAAAGCGRRDLPEIGTVFGTIKYNGKPLPGAKVAFRHDSGEGGRMATGISDADGEYELVYIEYPKRIYGAKAGPQKVIITTFLRNDDPGGPAPETLPKCYRGKESVLTAEVKPGVENQIDWDLSDDCSK